MAMATISEDKKKQMGIVEEEEKWVTHYSSTHQILLVGEGDFSFSLCLALSFASASNICTTSLDSYDTVIKKYKKAKSNLGTLEKLGASILHGVDATKMKLHPNLKMRKFDRIIFNFPHAGFYGKEDNKHMIEMHRSLVHGFFKNASTMLRANGEVHVSHKTKPPFDSWNLVELASSNSLSLNECVPFQEEDYPGYNHKRGDGPRCDEAFPLGECRTFKFRFSSDSKKSKFIRNKGFTNRRTEQLLRRSIQMQKQGTSFDLKRYHTKLNIDTSQFPGYSGIPLIKNNIPRESPRIFDSCFNNVRETFPRVHNSVDYFVHESPRFNSFTQPQTNVTRNMNNPPGYTGFPLTSYVQRERARIFDGCFDNARETLGRAGHNVEYSVDGSGVSGFERYMAGAPGRTLNGYLCLMDAHHRLSTLRSARLQSKGLHYSNTG
ncbi:hypothetical protein Patl1_16331 [Pistacia atlantica]|uniref:Uncharacterized protein n=1 Tax=Pistacia atlantica TaxID=434234 RepID=A0ACC1B9P0_9ROSI|nr:hypothetical protein Patl1_16331 [Pistacia atlantica]